MGIKPSETGDFWRQICEGYHAGRDGTIWSEFLGARLKGRERPGDKYLRVDLKGQGDCYVHRLIAFAFVPNPQPGVLVEVDHGDRNKHNNVPGNLEWVTKEENMKRWQEQDYAPKEAMDDRYTRRIGVS